MAIHYLSEQHSAVLITHELALEATRRAYLAVTDGDSKSFPVIHGQGHDPSNRFSMKSASTGELAGLKIGSYWHRNGEIGLTPHSSCILLLDQRTGRVAAVVEASKANGFRTAAGDALAVDALARADAKRLAVFGAGHQAEYECEAIMNVRRIAELYVVNRSPARAWDLARKLARTGLETITTTAREACRYADIIVTATSARAPLFDADAVQPGTHISCMGTDAVGKQELPPELLRRSALFCDEREQSLSIGEFQHVAADVRGGGIQPPRNLGDVLAGRLARPAEAASITIFDSSGLALQDLFLADCLLQQAQQRGLVSTL
jgi:ornithine cyclodeaminase